MHYVNIDTKSEIIEFVKKWKLLTTVHTIFCLTTAIYIFIGGIISLDLFTILYFPLEILKKSWGNLYLILAFVTSLQIIVSIGMMIIFIYSLLCIILSIIVLIKVYSSYVREFFFKNTHLKDSAFEKIKFNLITRQRLIFLIRNHNELTRCGKKRRVLWSELIFFQVNQKN